MKKFGFLLLIITIAGLILIGCTEEDIEEEEAITFNSLELSQKKDVIEKLVELLINPDIDYNDCTMLENPDTSQDAYCNEYYSPTSYTINIGEISSLGGTIKYEINFEYTDIDTSNQNWISSINIEYNEWIQEFESEQWEIDGDLTAEIDFDRYFHELEVSSTITYNSAQADGNISLVNPYIELNECELSTTIVLRNDDLVLTKASLCDVEIGNLNIMFLEYLKESLEEMFISY